MARLKIQEKKAPTPVDFELNLERVTMGRAPDNVLVLDDKAASRHHAEIRKSAGGWMLVDLGSSNGTWVDGKKIGTIALENGMVFLIGNTRLSFQEENWDGRTMQVDMQEMAAAVKAEAPPSSQVAEVPPPVEPSAPAGTPPVTPPPPVSPPPVAPPPAFQAAPPVASPPPVARPQQPAAPPAVVPPPQQPASPPSYAAPPMAAPDYGFRATSQEERAGFGIRLGAYLLDGLILTVIMVVLMLPAGFAIQLVARKAPELMIPLSIGSYLLIMAVSIGYLLVPWAKSGATPGKKMLRLRIVRDDGQPQLGYGKAFLRILGYMLSGLILDIGFLMILFNAEKKGLHDMIAGTHVIRT